MYYLDFTRHYRRTEKSERVAVRSEITGSIRDRIFRRRAKRQDWKCFFCGVGITIKDHLDHLLPVYRGGSSKGNNLVAACRSCNLIKGAEIIEITNPETIAWYLEARRDFNFYVEYLRKGGAKDECPKRLKKYRDVYYGSHANLFVKT